ncbi:MAG: hypothetical protein QME42_09700 [bacterium]|nr:hypothetical protein [bacterium]
MVKKVYLFGLIELLLVLVVGTAVYAEEVEPNCEVGDTIFRALGTDYVPWILRGLAKGFGHCGIYCCSQSDRDKVTIGTEHPYPIQINDSDFKHSVIQGNGYGTHTWPPGIKEVDHVTLKFALYGEKYWGAYNSGDLNALDRRQIIAAAYEQRGCEYAVGSAENDESVEDVKMPGKSFRCDGLVEYCYEVIGYEDKIARKGLRV